MKSLLKLLSVGLLVVNTTTYAVACDRQKYDNSIWIVTDGGFINDKSFNQSSWEGSNKFVQSLDGLNKPDYKASYFEPSASSIYLFRDAYRTAVTIGAKTLVLPGFKHIPALKYANEYAPASILIDGIFEPHFSAAFSFNHVVNMTYDAEVSGFEASLAGTAYLSSENKQGAGAIMATFGGIDNKTSVDNYMFGFLSGMSLWNYVLSNPSVDPGKLTVIQALKALFGKLVASYGTQYKTPKTISLAKSQGTLAPNGTFTKLTHGDLLEFNPVQWFSGSFDLGEAKAISSKLASPRSDNAQIIFPVAGRQIQDTVNLLEEKDYSSKRVIGADSDQGVVYGNKFVLTSALKNISQSVFQVLLSLKTDKQNYLGTTVSSAFKKFHNWNGVTSVPDAQAKTYHNFSKTGKTELQQNQTLQKLIYAYPQPQHPPTLADSYVLPSANSFVGLFNKYIASNANVQNWNGICTKILNSKLPNPIAGNLGKYLIDNFK